MSNNPKRDSLGDRIKNQYEDRTRYYLPRRTYTITRVDGKAFHTFTRGLNKPYDLDFMSCMDAAAISLCKEIAGARFAFVQSDEISILSTDFEDEGSQAWFDGNLQKWVSVSAATATAAFNNKVHEYIVKGNAKLGTTKKPTAVFDARAFSIPDYIEVENYFVWRQQDAARNSVTLLASNYASHKQLHGKSTKDRHDVIHAAGDNWANHPVRFKHGGVIRRNGVKEWGKDMEIQPEPSCYNVDGNWFLDHETPVFTQDKKYLRNLIPRHWEGDESARKM